MIGIVLFVGHIIVSLHRQTEHTSRWWMIQGGLLIGLFVASVVVYAVAGSIARWSAKQQYDRVVARWRMQKDTYNGDYRNFVKQITQEKQTRAMNNIANTVLFNALV